MSNLKESNIKNCICYYSDDIISINDIDLDKILLDEKSYKNSIIYHPTKIHHLTYHFWCSRWIYQRV